MNQDKIDRINTLYQNQKQPDCQKKKRQSRQL